jgi:hypothetical protein
MADQRSRGGKKKGADAPTPGQSEQHQTTHEREGQQESQRPDEGEPGGPKQSAGHTRPEHHKE